MAERLYPHVETLRPNNREFVDTLGWLAGYCLKPANIGRMHATIRSWFAGEKITGSFGTSAYFLEIIAVSMAATTNGD